MFGRGEMAEHFGSMASVDVDLQVPSLGHGMNIGGLTWNTKLGKMWRNYFSSTASVEVAFPKHIADDGLNSSANAQEILVVLDLVEVYFAMISQIET